MGPMANCLPEPLFRRGVDCVGGIRISDAEKPCRYSRRSVGPTAEKGGEFVTFKAG